MTAELSEELRSLLDTPVFVTVATIQPDGSPQLSPVWVKRTATTSFSRRPAAAARRRT